MFTANVTANSLIQTMDHSAATLNVAWLQQTDVNDDFELSNQYAYICQQHIHTKKWLLFINPEESSIEKLAKTHGVDVSKILMVNYKNSAKNHSKIALAQITSVLSKGNCSAVILSNTDFTQDEISQLENSACQGKTQCLLVKKQALH